MSKYRIKKVKKAVNNPYDVRDVYSIDTDEWFGSMEFLNMDALNKFLRKEGKI